LSTGEINEGMEILIIDIDSKIPNLALHKIAKYHTVQGDTVTWNFPLMKHLADKIYVSCVFTENRHLCEEWEGFAEIGGSGYDLKKTLPSEIDEVKPRINLGFTTRGCIRKCEFCIVPEKEGKIRAEGDIYDIWDGKSKNIVLLDNNILAMEKHFFKIAEQIIDNKLTVDFNQGLDHRLLNDDFCAVMKRMKRKYGHYRFAFDSTTSYESVEKAIDLLHKYKMKWNTWYVLVGYDTTLQEDIDRLKFLKERDERVYVQSYIKNSETRAVARWGNQRHLFAAKTFQQFLDMPGNGRYKNAITF